MCLAISAVFLNFPVSSLVFLKWSRIFLQKQRFSHRQSHGKTPYLGPFYLFSEPVPARGIIGIGLFHRKSRKCRKCVWKNSFKSWRLDRSAGQCNLELLWVRSIYLLLNPLGLDFSTVIPSNTERRQIHAQLRLQLKAVWAVQSAIKKIRSCWFIFKQASKISPKTYVTPLDVYSKHLRAEFWIKLLHLFI